MRCSVRAGRCVPAGEMEPSSRSAPRVSCSRRWRPEPGIAETDGLLSCNGGARILTGSLRFRWR